MTRYVCEFDFITGRQTELGKCRSQYIACRRCETSNAMYDETKLEIGQQRKDYSLTLFGTGRWPKHLSRKCIVKDSLYNEKENKNI